MAVILIVDDRPLCREFLVTLLKYSNHQLLEADDGAKAYEIVTSTRPHLIITDLLMPTMNGYELVQKIKSNQSLSDIPIIFYTASFLIDEAKLLAESCGVDYLLFKPCDPQLILDTVNNALDIHDVTTHQKSGAMLPMATILGKAHMSNSSNAILKTITSLDQVKEEFKPVINAIQNIGPEGLEFSKLSLAFSQAFDQMDKISCQLLAISDLTQNLISEHESKHLLKIFCDAANKIICSNHCFVGIVKNTNNIMQLTHYETTLQFKDDQGKSSSLIQNSSMVHTLLNEANVIVFNHITDIMQSELPEEFKGIQNYIGMRLITHSNLYGFVFFTDKLDGSNFDDQDSQFVYKLATELSMIYENINRYEIIQRHAAKLQISITKGHV